MSRMNGKTRTVVVSLFICLALSLTAVQSSTNCGWMMVTGNAANSASVDPACAPSKNRIKKLWEFISSDNITGMLEGNGKVYFSTGKIVGCLTSTEGKLLWSAQVNNPALVGVWNDRICVNADKQMIGYDASNGKLRWKKTGRLLSVTNGSIFYFDEDSPGVLISASVGDGDKFWEYKATKTTFQCDIEKIAIADGKCVIITKDWKDPGIDDKTVTYEANLHLFDFETGKQIWRKSISVDDFGYLAIYEGKICLHLKEIGLTMLDVATGQTIWFSPAALDYSKGTISIDSSKIIVQYEDTLCLNTSNGKKIWSAPIKREMSSQPALAGEKIWSSIAGQALVVCNRVSDGKQLWQWGVKPFEKSMLCVGDGKIFAVWSEAKTVIAFINASDKLVFSVGSGAYQNDGQQMTTAAVPYVFNNQAFVSMSLVIGNLGGFYSYDYKTQNLIISVNDVTAQLKIGKNQIVVNGKQTVLDKDSKIVPVIKNGYVMIPAKIIGDVFKIKSYINLKNKMIAFNASGM